MRYLLPEHRELPKYAHAIIRDLIEAGHHVESAAGLGSHVPSGEPDAVLVSFPLLRVPLLRDFGRVPVLDMDAGLLPVVMPADGSGDGVADLPDPEPRESSQNPSEAPSGAPMADLADELSRAVAEAVRIAVAEVLAKHLTGEEPTA